MVDYGAVEQAYHKRFAGNNIISHKVLVGTTGNRYMISNEQPLGAYFLEKDALRKSIAVGSATGAPAFDRDATVFEFRDIQNASRIDLELAAPTPETIVVATVISKINGLTNIATITRGQQEELYFLDLEAKFNGIVRTFVISAGGVITITDAVENGAKTYVSYSLDTLHRDTAGSQ